MANKDWAFGLQPTRGPFGEAPETVRLPLRQFLQASTPYTTAIYKGQVVVWDSTPGHVEPATTNSNTLLGVAAEYYAGSATTKTDIAVWMAGDHEFVIQSDGGTTSSNRASYLMKNFSFINVTAGNTNTGLSGMELDFSTGAAATAKPVKVYGFAFDTDGSTSGGANVNVRVKFNKDILQESITTQV